MNAYKRLRDLHSECSKSAETAPPDNLRTACVICGRLFQAPHGHLKGTLTCSAACFRERKRRKDKERWQRRNGQKGGA